LDAKFKLIKKELLMVRSFFLSSLFECLIRKGLLS